jgi:2-polyprenyl-3-methyl-5-hydroxy-6-metoxy-1,4-benzoquinol methylase
MERKDVWAAGDLYEPYVGRWSRFVARDFLAWLDVAADQAWLDVGCGTGALTQTVLQIASPKSVRGIDPSAGFVDYAREKTDDARASFEVGDAQDLLVDTASFDAVIAGFVLNFVPRPSLLLGCGGRPRRGCERVGRRATISLMRRSTVARSIHRRGPESGRGSRDRCADAFP